MSNTIESSRVLPIKGGFNFRDLGGLKTQDGRLIKQNLLFRTDELGNLLESDLELLADLNIQTVVDFRTEHERVKSVDKLPISCKNTFHLDIVSGNMDAYIAKIQSGSGDMQQLMLDLYEDLVLGENAITQFVKFFEIIQNPANTGVIFHCTAGKDRTGIATALILAALDVDWSAIEKDYLLSNIFLKEKYAAYIAKDPRFEALLTVNAAYLNHAFQSINNCYGSIRTYLQQILKVDLDLMRKIYIE